MVKAIITINSCINEIELNTTLEEIRKVLNKMCGEWEIFTK